MDYDLSVLQIILKPSRLHEGRNVALCFPFQSLWLAWGQLVDYSGEPTALYLGNFTYLIVFRRNIGSSVTLK